ncbi:MAG: hypothetical protein IKX33_00760 [Prevotella sp.]|nr:hypothetical protein [Prevotella sp.]
MTIVFGMCSCGSDDDEPEVAVASQVAGSYTGEEIMTVMGDAFNSNPTYVFVKSSDISVDMTIPASEGGSMVLPSLPVKNITLAKTGNTITGKLASYTGTVVNSDGAEKAYTVSDVIVIFSGNAVVATYTLKYGNMPFAFAGQFTGTKK